MASQPTNFISIFNKDKTHSIKKYLTVPQLKHSSALWAKSELLLFCRICRVNEHFISITVPYSITLALRTLSCAALWLFM